MSPRTAADTRCRVTPRPAAALASPEVRHPAIACSRNPTAAGPLLSPISTAGWATSKVKGSVRLTFSWPGPRKPWMTERLWVPSIHLFPARNWNCAIPGCPFTPSMTANTLGTSTPLRAGRVMVGSPSVRWSMTTLGTRPSPDLPHRRQGRDVGGRFAEGRGPILCGRAPELHDREQQQTGSPEDPAIEPMARQYRHTGTDDRPPGPRGSARETVEPSTGVEYPVTTPGLQPGWIVAAGVLRRADRRRPVPLRAREPDCAVASGVRLVPRSAVGGGREPAALRRG